MWYDVDYKRLGILILPTFLRKPILVSWVHVLLMPISNLHYTWKQKRLADWYKLNHTGQVCFLRKVLNDTLDVADRRIYIDEGNSFPRKYIYTRAENKPVFLGKMHIYQNSEYTNTGVDFIVFAPVDIINTRIHELNALITFYKLASKRYKIQPI
ncbi:hypothetical protein DB891_03885 [Flavobacterium laiguense]|uniref:Uncharacterized protein n=2 Tax=Flavobacterium laiguense TaxID=2169409 RepID=A0A2U1K0Q0_9FLAO|nr:hypothetical protein DB891_03885 [Flavobacterium laiguense]